MLEHAKFRPQGSSRRCEYQSPVITPQNTHIHIYTDTYPCRLKNLLLSRQQHLSIQVLLNAAIANSVFKQLRVPVGVHVCVRDVSKHLTSRTCFYAKKNLFSFLSVLCAVDFFIIPQGSDIIFYWHRRWIDAVKIFSLCAAWKFEAASWCQRTAVVGAAFTSAGFTTSFRESPVACLSL